LKRDRAGDRERPPHPPARENDVPRRATWDEASQWIAEGFRRDAGRLGLGAFAMPSCARLTDETRYPTRKFVDVHPGEQRLDLDHH
jgi:predicted molibdopterin-dependent oxidoreductase YjgC